MITIRSAIKLVVAIYLLGLAVGFEGMLAILIVASLLALIVGTVKRIVQKEKNLRLAFVPFIATGYYLTLVPQFI